jgi:hypothetical protein
LAFLRDGIIFSGWAGVGFYPAVTDECRGFEPVEQGIQGALYDDHLSLRELVDEVRGVNFPPRDNVQYAVL